MSELAFRVVNTGALRKGEQLALGRCFRLTHYQLGSGGHNPEDGLPLTVDVTKANVISPIIPITEIPVGALTQTGPRTTLFQVTLPNSFASGTISTIGLFGTITYVENGNDTTLIGTQFLYAVCNIQKFIKTSSEERTLKLFLHHAA